MPIELQEDVCTGHGPHVAFIMTVLFWILQRFTVRMSETCCSREYCTSRTTGSASIPNCLAKNRSVCRAVLSHPGRTILELSTLIIIIIIMMIMMMSKRRRICSAPYKSSNNRDNFVYYLLTYVLTYDLPSDITSSPSLLTFKQRLKCSLIPSLLPWSYVLTVPPLCGP